MKRLTIAATLITANLCSPASADEFQDCADCPEMVEVPGGTFTRSLYADAPRQDVTIETFALGKYEVTIAEFEAFVGATGHETPGGCAVFDVMGAEIDNDATWRRPGYPLDQRAPALCLTFEDATAYAAWLADITDEPYRLPTEAEWDYAAHAGQETNASYFLRAGLSRNEANCHDCNGFDLMGREDLLRALPVDIFDANAFGLHVMFGNAAEWVADCYHPAFEGAPVDGTAWREDNCEERLVRGGGWHSFWADLAGGRPATDPGIRDNAIGFRVARDLD